MEKLRSQSEIIEYQKYSRMMKYYLGYYGWIPAIIITIAALVDLVGFLPSFVGKAITFGVAVLSLIALTLQKPEKAVQTKTLEGLKVPSPSFPESAWYMFKYWLRKSLVRMKQWIHRS